MIISVNGDGDFGFIGIETVVTENGENPSELKTSEDIYIHREDCASSLVVGINVSFLIKEDRKRGDGFYRAFGAIEAMEAEIVQDGEEVITGFYAVSNPQMTQELTTITPRANYHISAKEIPAEEVEKVLKNKPMEEIPRGFESVQTEEKKLRLLSMMLGTFFPTLSQFQADFNILESDSEELDEAVRENEINLEAIGMSQQIEDIRMEVASFNSMKATLKLIYDDGLVRPDTIIPIKYLPDLFMAVPVWYFWTPQEKIGEIEDI